MLKIDHTLLKDLGLDSLPAEEKNKLLEQIYETLQTRVGMRLAAKMSDAQLDEFEAYLPDEKTGTGGDEEGARAWLEANFPNYKSVVAEELNKLKEEIKSQSDQILKSVEQKD